MPPTGGGALNSTSLPFQEGASPMDTIRLVAFRDSFVRFAVALYLFGLLAGPAMGLAQVVAADSSALDGIALRHTPNDDPEPGFG